MAGYRYLHHPHLTRRAKQGPAKTADQHPTSTAVQRFNTRVAIAITRAVGSMWCAYVFAVFDLISLPAAIRGGIATTVSWIAQTFLQLVLLSIIMVGQDVQSKAGDARAEQTFLDTEAILHEINQLQQHAAAQDAQAEQILAIVQAHAPGAAA